MSDAPRLRLFVAASLPHEILEGLDRSVAPHRELVPKARWSPLANQHVTLKFLGHVDAGMRPQIESVCEQVAQGLDPASLSVGGTGAFPNPKRARVLWAGIDDPAELLTRAASALDERLEPLGFEAEARRFTPHLTLARLRTPAPVQAFVDAVDYRSDDFRLEALTLYLSRLSPKGARYEALESFVFGRDGTHG